MPAHASCARNHRPRRYTHPRTNPARRAHRGWWMAGAALMGLVVVKLFLVELGNTGTVARIVSFIAIGALLLVLGYVAPAPPRAGVAQVKE